LARYAALLVELTAEFELKFFALENVSGLRETRKHASYLAEFRSTCIGAGFRLHEAVLESQHFGVPQKRRRLFIVGVNEKAHELLGFALPENGRLADPVTVRDAISHLPEPAFFERGLKAEAIPHHPNHWTMRPRSNKFQDLDRLLKGGHRRSFKVLDWDKPSPTVAYGNREIHLHPSARRRLSIYEAMLLQGFPPNYQLLGTLSAQVRLVGDSVPPPLAKAVAEGLYALLTAKEPTPNVTRVA
jgi:DNA (cytosine-5)-methyltransferase 1